MPTIAALQERLSITRQLDIDLTPNEWWSWQRWCGICVWEPGSVKNHFYILAQDASEITVLSVTLLCAT
jgi:hypothetical protein